MVKRTEYPVIRGATVRITMHDLLGSEPLLARWLLWYREGGDGRWRSTAVLRGTLETAGLAALDMLYMSEADRLLLLAVVGRSSWPGPDPGKALNDPVDSETGKAQVLDKEGNIIELGDLVRFGDGEAVKVVVIEAGEIMVTTPEGAEHSPPLSPGLAVKVEAGGK